MDLFQDFVVRSSKLYPDELEQLQNWIKRIGTEIGADERYFRNEAFLGGDAKALPPGSKYLEYDNNLRLYCMVYDRQNVILFNGGFKTANRAQDCPNVNPHFRLANQLCRKIHKAVIEKDIRIKDDGSLDFDNDFCIEIN